MGHLSSAFSVRVLLIAYLAQVSTGFVSQNFHFSNGVRYLPNIKKQNLCNPRPSILAIKSIAPGTFEPQMPDLASSVVVLTSTFGLAAYWWLVFVPSERRDLAKNKNKGGLNSYLEELEVSEGRDLEKWFYTEWLQRRRKVRKMAEASNSPEAEIEREISQAAKTPNFISLDNPVMVALVISMTGVAFSLLSAR